jgi:hypothetical protein
MTDEFNVFSSQSLMQLAMTTATTQLRIIQPYACTILHERVTSLARDYNKPHGILTH